MEKEKNFNVNLAVIATGIMAFSGVLIETAMNVTFPALIQQFQLETSQVQWVTTIYLLMIAIIVPLSSYLIKNYSMRHLFSWAITLFLVGVGLSSIPISFSFLLLGRVLQGIATGIALPLMFNIILTKVPEERRGLMIGIGTLTTSIAPALGPTYGGILTSTIGWPFIYILLLPILFVTALVGLHAIPPEQVQKNERLNIGAGITLAILFSCLLLSFSFYGKPVFWMILIIAMVSGAVFTEFNKRNPLIDLAVFENKQFRKYLACFLIFQAMLLGVSFILPNFMQLALGKSSFHAGLMMFPGALIGAIFAPLSGRILDRVGPQKPILFGLMMALLGWVCLSTVLTSGNFLLIIGSHVLFMIGVGFAYSNVMTMGLSALPTEEYADGNAIFNTLQQLAGAIATALVALVMGIFQKNNVSFTAGTSAGAQFDLYLLLGLLIVGVLVILQAFWRNRGGLTPSNH